MKAKRLIITGFAILLIAFSAFSQWQNPVNCGAGVNSSIPDIAPCLNLTGDTVYFASSRTGGLGLIDIWMSVYQGYAWQPATNLGAPINTTMFESSPAISTDGQTLYFAALNRPGGVGGWDIWVSQKTGGVWGTPTNVNPINSTGNDQYVFISRDGLRLYFCSDRPGGVGTNDIYVSQWSGTAWGAPTLIPGSVNTTFEENHPSITQDGLTMYFSSNRTGGLGNPDIYMSTWSGTAWTAAQNVGSPINGTSFDQFPTVTGDGLKLVFATDRAGGSGNLDLWQSSFGPPDMWGIVSLEGNPPDLSGSIVVVGTVSDTTDSQGFYLLHAVSSGQVNMEVSHEGYTTLDTVLTDPAGELNVMLYLRNLWGTVSLEGNPPDLSGSIVIVGTASDTTDSQGYYFIQAVPQGTVAMEVSHTGYVTYDTSLVDPVGEFNVMLYLSGPPPVFFDDFESGLGNWTGTWALTTASYHSPTNSLTDSPTGNYSPNQNVSETMAQNVSLSTFQSAELTYWTKYALETGFDYTYLEATTNNGANWLNVRTYNGTQTDWRADTIDIGTFAGQPTLKFRFRLTSDGGLEMDGFYVDDFRIEGGHEDLTPPLIVHTPDPDTTSWMGDQVIMAEITDVSGVDDASLYYSVDGSFYTEITYDSISGDNYYFTIPAQEAGAWVEYYFEATDEATPPNTGESEVYAHIFGIILYYDDGDPEYIYAYAAGNRIAVRCSTVQPRPLKALFFRFYKDDTHDLDTVDVYVWSNAGGYPSQALLGPIPMYPVNTLETPEAWTRVDLRSYGLTADPEFHVGCQFRSVLPVILGDSPAVSNRTSVYTVSWAIATTDLHIRAVVDQYTDVPEVSSSNVPMTFSLLPAYPNPFNATCVVPFTLNRQTHVRVLVYNILGQKVATLLDGIREAGSHQLVWNAEGLSTGIYFLQLKSMTDATEQTPIRKVLLLK